MPPLRVTKQKHDAANQLSVVQRYYRSFRPGRRLRVIQPDGQTALAHLQQGDLDGACGPYCLLMALTILGVAPRRGWENVSQRKSGAFVALWRMLSERFFSGSHAADVIDCIEEAPDGISYVVSEGRPSAIVDFCVEHLCRDAIVLLGINHERRAYGHWTLVIGWEHYCVDSLKASRRVVKPRNARALLCLDPSHAEPYLTAYNLRIDVERYSRRALTVEMIGSDKAINRVTLDTAIAIRRAPPTKSRVKKETVK